MDVFFVSERHAILAGGVKVMGISTMQSRAHLLPRGVWLTPKSSFLRGTKGVSSLQSMAMSHAASSSAAVRSKPLRPKRSAKPHRLLQRKVKKTVSAVRRGQAAHTAAQGRALEKTKEQSQFLLKAGEILSSSLDYQTTLKNIADLVVPRLAEWCTIDLKGEDGVIRQLAIAHADPRMVRAAKELNRKYPTDNDEETGNFLG
jgi:hypothetical protein